MPFAPYIPDASVWTKYFMDQVNAKNRSQPKKASDANAPIGGGVAVQDGKVASRLTTVGKAKDMRVKGHQEPVKVEITSPSEASVEQATSELKHIRADSHSSGAITKATTKGKTRAKKRRASPAKIQGRTAKKRRHTKSVKDIFSK